MGRVVTTAKDLGSANGSEANVRAILFTGGGDGGGGGVERWPLTNTDQTRHHGSQSAIHDSRSYSLIRFVHQLHVAPPSVLCQRDPRLQETTRWLVPSRLLVSPPEERLPGSSWPRRLLVRAHHPPVVSRNPIATGRVR